MSIEKLLLGLFVAFVLLFGRNSRDDHDDEED